MVSGDAHILILILTLILILILILILAGLCPCAETVLNLMLHPTPESHPCPKMINSLTLGLVGC
jgi:hypothetical protein